MLQVGGSPQRLAALQSGAVQGAALDFMSGLRLSKLGYTVLAQVSLNYPYLGPVLSAKFLREKLGARAQKLPRARRRSQRSRACRERRDYSAGFRSNDRAQA